MVRIRTAHPIRVFLLICAVAAFPSLFLCSPAADADILEQVTGKVEQVVSPVVQTPTVQQVEETVTTTAQEATATIAPPATKAAAAATSSAAGTAGAATGPADAVTEKVRKLVGGNEATAGVASAAGAATRSAEAAVHAAKGGAEATTGATLPDPSVPSATAPTPSVPSSTTADAPTDASGVTGVASSSPTPTDLPPSAPRTTYVPPPGNDGSTGAPLPRWIAYVWPAVALTGPSLAHFGESWGQAIARLATGASAGSDAEGGVAGVHASGGRPEASSVPLFSRLPSEVRHAFSSVPTPVFVYLGLLVLAVIAVALGVRREVAVGRRH